MSLNRVMSPPSRVETPLTMRFQLISIIPINPYDIQPPADAHPGYHCFKFPGLSKPSTSKYTGMNGDQQTESLYTMPSWWTTSKSD